MFSLWSRMCFCILLVAVFILPLAAEDNNPRVLLVTNMGEIEIELYSKKAPVSVENFLAYVQSGFYNGTLFHRVIDGFMIQGGGYDLTMNAKTTRSPIANEAKNGLHNKRGTIAYARTESIHSATSQFFINLVDNDFLDHTGDTPNRFGYAVFGKVTRGMHVVDAIGKVKTESRYSMDDVPAKPVVLLSAKVLEEKKESDKKEK